MLLWLVFPPLPTLAIGPLTCEVGGTTSSGANPFQQRRYLIRKCFSPYSQPFPFLPFSGSCRVPSQVASSKSLQERPQAWRSFLSPSVPSPLFARPGHSARSSWSVLIYCYSYVNLLVCTPYLVSSYDPLPRSPSLSPARASDDVHPHVPPRFAKRRHYKTRPWTTDSLKLFLTTSSTIDAHMS